MPLVCDSCSEELVGARVQVTTEATDDRGTRVLVAKRWQLCRACAERVADKIGEPSPWADADAKTIVADDDDTMTMYAGGYQGLRP